MNILSTSRNSDQLITKSNFFASILLLGPNSCWGELFPGIREGPDNGTLSWLYPHLKTQNAVDLKREVLFIHLSLFHRKWSKVSYWKPFTHIKIECDSQRLYACEVGKVIKRRRSFHMYIYLRQIECDSQSSLKTACLWGRESHQSKCITWGTSGSGMPRWLEITQESPISTDLSTLH